MSCKVARLVVDVSHGPEVAFGCCQTSENCGDYAACWFSCLTGGNLENGQVFSGLTASLYRYPSYSKLLKPSCWEKHQVYSGVDGLLAQGGVP